VNYLLFYLQQQKVTTHKWKTSRNSSASFWCVSNFDQ